MCVCANDARGLPVFDCGRVRACRPGSSDRLLPLLPACPFNRSQNMKVEALLVSYEMLLKDKSLFNKFR